MLAYERTGTGEPLVLLHGITHRRQAWHPVVDRLAKERDVILVDLPGHGDSPPLRLVDGSPGAGMVADLRELFRALGLDRPHVAGNSLGGQLALELAAAGAVRSVTALSPSGFWRSNLEFAYTATLFKTVLGIASRIDPLAERLTATRTGRALLFSWINNRPMRLTPEAALADFRALLRSKPGLAPFFAASAPLHVDIDPEVPVTIAWARRDLVLLPYQATVARKRLPAAKHLYLPQCGHVPMGDAPEVVARVILRGSRQTVGSS